MPVIDRSPGAPLFFVGRCPSRVLTANIRTAFLDRGVSSAARDNLPLCRSCQDQLRLAYRSHATPHLATRTRQAATDWRDLSVEDNPILFLLGRHAVRLHHCILFTV